MTIITFMINTYWLYDMPVIHIFGKEKMLISSSSENKVVNLEITSDVYIIGVPAFGQITKQPQMQINEFTLYILIHCGTR